MKLALELTAVLIAFICLSNALRTFADLRLLVNHTAPVGPQDFPAHWGARRRKRATTA